jgi:hypothetical protein
VAISPPPVAGFSAEPSAGAYPLEVTFVNSSLRATHYLWDFSDGTGASSMQESPRHIFNDTGSFKVILTALNDQQCEDSIEKTITTVAPLPDADIELISLAANADGTSRLIVTVHNRGNTVLKDLPVNIDFSGSLSLREIIHEPILPSAKFNLIVSSAILNVSSLRYLCVSIDVPGDLFPGGNRKCQQFENELLVFSAYPNPATTTLNIEWIAEANQIARISLVNALGARLLHAEKSTVQGLNQQAIDVSGLAGGIYFLVIEAGNSKNSQRILLLVKP